MSCSEHEKREEKDVKLLLNPDWMSPLKWLSIKCRCFNASRSNKLQYLVEELITPIININNYQLNIGAFDHTAVL